MCTPFNLLCLSGALGWMVDKKLYCISPSAIWCSFNVLGYRDCLRTCVWACLWVSNCVSVTAFDFQGGGSNAIRCRKDGNWTGSFRLCSNSRGQCSLPQNLHHSLQYTCKRGHSIGLCTQLFSQTSALPLHSHLVLISCLEKDLRHTSTAAYSSKNFRDFCLSHTKHAGEECELTCREVNNAVVILPSNMTAESVLKEHWRKPQKVKVSLSNVVHKVLHESCKDTCIPNAIANICRKYLPSMETLQTI